MVGHHQLCFIILSCQNGWKIAQVYAVPASGSITEVHHMYYVSFYQSTSLKVTLKTGPYGIAHGGKPVIDSRRHFPDRSCEMSQNLTILPCADCWVTISWPPTSAVLATRMTANGQPLPERCRASCCRVWTNSVTPHLYRCRRPYKRTIPASRLCCDGSVQPAHSLRHASTVTHDRRAGEIDHRLLIDYYKTNIDYENK